MYQTNSKQENSFSSLVMKKSNFQKSPKKLNKTQNDTTIKLNKE